MLNLENLLKIIREIESTHRGLGVPLSFNLLSVLAKHSVFNIASPGKGKTHIIFSIINGCAELSDTIINNWNAMTYYELVEKLPSVSNKTLLWTVEEWSMLTEHHRELLMAIGSKIQTDRRFERLVAVRGFAVPIKIENCDLVMLIAIQPFKFKKLMRESDNWNALASDRFIKFPFINPLQQDIKRYPPKFTLPEMSNPVISKPNNMLVKLFESHLTTARAQLAVMKFQEAWCKLNNKLIFTTTDALAFKALYGIYLDLYPLMISAYDPDREESFHTGPFRILEYFMNHFGEEIDVHQLEYGFHMSNTDESARTIYRHLNILEHHNIIKSNSPTYSLSDKYQNYFDNYRSNWK